MLRDERRKDYFELAIVDVSRQVAVRWRVRWSWGLHKEMFRWEHVVGGDEGGRVERLHRGSDAQLLGLGR